MDASLRPAIEDFFEEQEYKGNSPATVDFYRTNVEHFLRDTGITELDQFTETRVRRWLIGHKHLSRATLRTYDRALRVVSNWLHHRGYLETNPMSRLPKPASRATTIVTFKRPEVVAMLDEARRRRNQLRDRALILLLLDTGIRIGEAMGLDFQSVDWRECSISVTGKTGSRNVPIGRKAKRALRTHIDRERVAASRNEQRLFLTPSGKPLASQAATQAVRRIAEAAGAKATKIGPHTFRHTFALEYIRAGGDSFTLQRILGHTTMDMTRRYVHLADCDLRQSHRRYAPADRWL